MRCKDKDSYFRQRCETEPRLTELSDEGAINLLVGMINSCRLEACGDEITFARLVNNMLRSYSTPLRDLSPVYKERYMPKDPNGYSIDYESLLTNTYNFDWRYELKEYLDTGLLVGRKIKQ